MILSLKAFIYHKIEIDLLKLTISSGEANDNKLDNLSYKFAHSDDQDQLAVAMKSINLKQISQRFDKNDKCLIISNNNEILYYFWFAYNEIILADINESMRLNNDQVFLYDYSAITNSKVENIFHTICQKLVEEDKKEILTAINFANQDPSKKFGELGFKKYNRIVKRKILKKEFDRVII